MSSINENINSMTTKTIFKTARTLTIISFGVIIFTIGFTAFLLPHKITGSGVSGIGALIYYATGFPVGYTYLLVNIVLLLVAVKMLGASFGIKTIFGVVIESVLLFILQPLIQIPAVEDKFLSAIIGGGLCGVGIGTIFTQGGSTGGTDIVAMIVTKYKNISPGKVILLCDVFIIGSSYFVLTDFEPAKRIETIVYGYVTMAIQAYAIDSVLSGNKQFVQIFVFSKKYEEIATQITTQLGRGVTIIDTVGWYTREEQKMAITIVKKQEAGDIYRIIKEIDREAFISEANVMGVYGKGFERLKA